MNMKMLAAAVVFALPLAAQAETPDIKPGQWEFTSVTNVEGDVDMPERTDTDSQCITAEDLESADFGFIEEEEGCELLDQDIRADGLSYSMACHADDGEAMIDGEMRFMGERIEGDIEIDTESDIGQMTMHTEIEGSYQGECQDG
ncbi:DUF3617 family protein [Halomonas piscis]|uniref:DUF3617 family protein n=1 Tax=Halomonas piscis TaxID=3031727 RepID=A0ABY9YWS0_9GAMM|nr:DUF3617 family protein [Halomonas piscis]WNK19308.1 DUF3617 family protein [Halomonas piscis]